MSECEEWGGYRLSTGYGQVQVKGKKWLAHRYVWTQKVGPIPEGMNLCHTCDNPSCVNIDHLFVGTQQDNMIDMTSKGRQRGAFPKGSAHPGSKLSQSDVDEIRGFYSEGFSQKEIGERYGIHQVTVSEIVTRKIWK